MPNIAVNGTRLYYEESGSGPETLIFAHGLLFDGDMFKAQIEALSPEYRCISFDFRGQGRSAIADAGYDMDSLAEDTAQLIKALDAAPCHFCGLSMGGFVGMRLAIGRPELIRSLMLLETSAEPEEPRNVPRYRLLNIMMRWFGVGAVVGRVLPILFGQKFLADSANATQIERFVRRLKSASREGLSRAVKGVIDREGVVEELQHITCPTLVIVGDQDVATVPARSKRIHSRIAGSRMVVIPGAGHSSCIEAPQAVNSLLRDFLLSVSTRTSSARGPATI